MDRRHLRENNLLLRYSNGGADLFVKGLTEADREAARKEYLAGECQEKVGTSSSHGELPPHLQDYNDRMGHTVDYVKSLGDPRLRAVVSLRMPVLLQDYPEFRDCSCWEDYLDVYKNGPLTKEKRFMLFTMMTTVWDGQIPPIEQEIMRQLGLEYIEGTLVGDNINGETQVRQARSMGCIGHLLTRHKQNKFVAQLRFVEFEGSG